MMNGVDYVQLRRPARDRDFERCKSFLTSRCGLSAADAAMAVDVARNLLRLPDQRIGAAGVAEYWGDEVGGAEKLDPKRKYRLLRPPEALERAAKTAVFELPLLDGHPDFDTDTSTDTELAQFRIGSLGKVRWDGRHLLASISVTRPDAIAAILSGAKRAWSIGYHRETDMTPGVFEGEKYDGALVEIELTHCSLVDVSRCPAARLSFPNGDNP